MVKIPRLFLLVSIMVCVIFMLCDIVLILRYQKGPLSSIFLTISNLSFPLGFTNFAERWTHVHPLNINEKIKIPH
jgi:hypothetical protein